MTVPVLILGAGRRPCSKIVSPVGSPDVKCPEPTTFEWIVYKNDGTASIQSFCLGHLNTAADVLRQLTDLTYQRAAGLLPDPRAGDPTSGEGSPL
jgi:hypothetical protein